MAWVQEFLQDLDPTQEKPKLARPSLRPGLKTSPQVLRAIFTNSRSKVLGRG